MKKLAAILLATAMALTCVACGGNTEGNEGGSKVEITDANEILTKVWYEYKANAGEDVQFQIFGGYMANPFMDTPAKYDVTLEDAEDALTTVFCVPTDAIASIDDVATMMNAMMANNFT